MASDIHVDLNKKTTVELAELLERLTKVLNNKSLLANLPDKGEKIASEKEKVEKFYNQRLNELNTTVDLLSKLKITDSKRELDGDDDQRKEMSDSRSSEHNVFYDKLSSRIDQLPSDPNNKRLNTFHIKSSMGKKVHDKWKSSTKEESAARYPAGSCTDAQLVSLSESAQLQEKHVAKIREAQVEEAKVYLSSDENLKFSMLKDYVPDPEMRMAYREEVDSSSDRED